MNVALATTLVATFLACFGKLGGFRRGRKMTTHWVLSKESGEGRACMLGCHNASVVGNRLEEGVEGLHGVEVGGCFEGCTVLEINEPIKGVGTFKVL